MKRTIIDWEARLEYHQASGSRYRIDRRLERRGSLILLDRSYVNHAQIAAIRSVLLPKAHLWVLFIEGTADGPPYACYMHIAQIRDEGSRVIIDDLYLDVVIGSDGSWHVVDIDEFAAAIEAGELTPAQVQAGLKGLQSGCRLAAAGTHGLEERLHEIAELTR